MHSYEQGNTSISLKLNTHGKESPQFHLKNNTHGKSENNIPKKITCDIGFCVAHASIVLFLHFRMYVLLHV